jgi:phosphopentomutase
MSNNMKKYKGKMKTLGLSAVACVAAVGAKAQDAAATGYISDITDGIDSVIGIWDVIVPVMIGIVVVTVGLRFAKKLR